MENININLGDRTMSFRVKLFEEDKDIDIDRLLRIDYQNLIAEIASFPVILNRFGIILAQMNSKVQEADLDLRIFKAKIREEARNHYEKKKIKWTLDMIDSKMRSDPKYLAKYIKLNRVKKECEYINSIYWSAKSKSDVLQKLSLTIQPGDIDIKSLSKEFNGIVLKIKDNLIQ